MNTMLTNPNMLSMRTTLEHSLLKYVNTDDPILNYMFTFLIISLIGAIVPKMEKLPGFIISVFYNFFNFFVSKISYYYRKKNDILKKTVFIEKITDEQNINPLYSAVSWYIMNNFDMSEELNAKYMVSKKFSEYSTEEPELLRRPYCDVCKKLIFQDKEINYKLTANSVKIDGDEHNRRNDIVELWIYTKQLNDMLLDEFINHCIKTFIISYNKNYGKHYVYHNNGGMWEKVSGCPEKVINTLVLKNNDKQILLDEVNHFMNNKDWYLTKGFVYSLGILLHGPPGTGKTSLIRYLSYLVGRNVYYLRIGQIDSENTFINLLKTTDLSKIILVMEDIDCASDIVLSRDIKNKNTNTNESINNLVNEGANLLQNQGNILKQIIENIDNSKKQNDMQSNKKMPLSALLNMLDGVLTTDGQIVILTTNHIETLDEAILRPGRIDIKILLSKCDRTMIQTLCKNFYENKYDNTQYRRIIDCLINCIQNDIHTPAYVMNTFRLHKNDILSGICELLPKKCDKELLISLCKHYYNDKYDYKNIQHLLERIQNNLECMSPLFVLNIFDKHKDDIMAGLTELI